jgi:hypothetical protein
VAKEDLNVIELKTFIAASNEGSDLPANAGGITRNDFLNISEPRT